MCSHNHPQFRGPHGPHGERSVPGRALRGRGYGDRRDGRGPRGGASMIFEGTAFKYGRDVDTDVIIPARYLNTHDPDELAAHCMEDIDKDFVDRVQPGDIIVAEENFGCGSSREQAPVAIKAAGVSCVVAASFARIFYRNAINIGLPILVCPEAAGDVEAGDRLRG